MDENTRIMWQMDDGRIISFVEKQEGEEPIYAIVDDYEKAISAIEGLVLSLDDMRTIIRIDTDVDNAGYVREALELTAGASKAIVKQARNLEQSMKDRFTQYMTRLGRRRYHELVCLHGFGSQVHRVFFLHINVLKIRHHAYHRHMTKILIPTSEQGVLLMTSLLLRERRTSARVWIRLLLKTT